MFNHGIVYTCDSRQQQSSVCRSAQSADEPNIEFIVQFGTSDLDNAEDVFADSSGVYVVGLTDGTFSGQTNEGGDDAFIRKYNSDGDERCGRASLVHQALILLGESLQTHQACMWLAARKAPSLRDQFRPHRCIFSQTC
jgi:hypothetical protein